MSENLKRLQLQPNGLGKRCTYIHRMGFKPHSMNVCTQLYIFLGFAIFVQNIVYATQKKYQ